MIVPFDTRVDYDVASEEHILKVEVDVVMNLRVRSDPQSFTYALS